MIRIISLIVVLELASSSLAFATKIGRTSIEELFKEADYVAVVRIDAGETLWAGDNMCGAKYRAVVLDGIKGVAKGEQLDWNTTPFQSFSELEIGTTYLIFLTKPGKRYDPLASTNSGSEQRKAEFEQVCRSNLQENRTMHSGFGTMIIKPNPYSKAEDKVKIRSIFITIPDKIKVEPDTGNIGIDVWGNLKDLEAYLKSLDQ